MHMVQWATAGAWQFFALFVKGAQPSDAVVSKFVGDPGADSAAKTEPSLDIQVRPSLLKGRTRCVAFSVPPYLVPSLFVSLLPSCPALPALPARPALPSPPSS